MRSNIKPSIVRRTAPRRAAALILAAVALTLPGCGALSDTGEPPDVAALSQMTYPRQTDYAPDLDIIAVREGGDLRLVNRTPRSYADVVVWLNEQYVGRINRIDIGTENYVPLAYFINRHGEEFPVGGLLNPDKTEPVVMAELVNPGTGSRHRLTARPVLPEPIISEGFGGQ